MNYSELIEGLGFSPKSAKVYLATLALGEGTVQDIAKQAKLKRTTVYSLLEELISAGALVKTHREKKTYYVADAPTRLLIRARDRIREFEEALHELEAHKASASDRPRTYFLYGVPGFKQVWQKLFDSKEKEYLIITQGDSFLNFVHEGYILQEIIAAKRKLGISSRQLVSDSPYTRKIISKDLQENRRSKLLPARHKLPYTQIITQKFVALISPRFENMLLVIESESFAQTQASLFNILWDALPEQKTK